MTRRLPWWKFVLFALLPLIGLVLLLEGTLWVLGLGDPDERLSLTRGFSDSARYLLPDAEHPGGWVTQLFDDDTSERIIPPRSERLRVVLFGGSNTQGFPTDYLQEQLDLLAPEPGVEVVNLGRAGYGSERVLIILRQAMVLDPDVILVYSGHNEFIEAGFALELVQLWQRPWIARAVDHLSRLRTLNVAASLLESARQPASDEADLASRPEEHRPRGEHFQELRYEDTLKFYDVYRLNLQAMLRAAEEHDVPVVLCTVVGNMLDTPMVPGVPEDLSSEDLAGMRRTLAAAYERIPERLRRGLLQVDRQPATRLTARDWGEALDAAAASRRRALRATVHLPEPPALRALAPPFDGGPHWLDPALWSDRPMEVLPTVAALHQRQLDPQERLSLEEAARLLRDLDAEHPHQSMVLYPLGLVAYALGDDDRAVACLRDAARFDRAPTRGNDVTNGIVRELAREHPEVLLVDAEEHVRAACPSGLIGYEIMMDNCHLHPAVRPRLMDLFAPGLVELAERHAKQRAAEAQTAGH